MPDKSISIILEIKDHNIKGDFEKIISVMEGFRLQNLGGHVPCDLLILEVGNNLKREFDLIQSVLASGMAMEVFLTSARLEPDLLIQALRAGAKEFFPQPIKQEEVVNALLKFKDRKGSLKPTKQKKKRGKIIDVIGSKGGVGTTTIAVNLATSLVESAGSPSVALIDMNLLFGEIPIFLNIESAFNWGEVARNISRLDATYLMSILSKHSSGIYILPSPTGLDGINVATPEIIEKILNEMEDVFDFIIVDGGQPLDDVSLKILELSDIVLLVAILSLPCLTNVKRLLWTFRRLGYPPEKNIKIVVSRYHKKSTIPLKEAEESIDNKIYWLILNDFSTTMSAINRGKTLVSIAPKEEITKNLKDLANSFLGK